MLHGHPYHIWASIMSGFLGSQIERRVLLAHDIILAWLVCSSVVGCAQRSPRIQLTLPINQEGVFAVWESPDCEAVQVVNGVASIAIPKGGIACVKGVSGLWQKWHSTDVKLADGTPVPDYFTFANPPNDGIVVWCELFSTSDAQYYYIGNVKNIKALRSQNLGSKEWKQHMLKDVK